MEEKLRQLQLIQVDILKEIDSVCKKNDLKYSLYAGTLLGAVRHRGFIPWDDDLDICMPREDYEKFLRVWKNEEHPGYLIQNKEISPRFSQSFSKIRKDHTTFLQKGERSNQYHLGIFVDIFPIDRMPNKKLQRQIFRFVCILYQIYTREQEPIYGNRIEKMVTKVILFLTTEKKRHEKRKKLLKIITKWNGNLNLELVATECLETIMIPLPAKLLDEYVEMEFEGEMFMCFKMWDEYLTLNYRDYMQLPPEEARVLKHHPLILDFEHNIDELCK